jgi:metal-responsive CopG/Arc/MetJ family transcriptional regulator
MRGGCRPGAGRPRAVDRKRQVLLHLPEGMDDVLTEAAGESGLSRSEYVEQALRNRLKRDENLTARQKKLISNPEPTG